MLKKLMEAEEKASPFPQEPEAAPAPAATEEPAAETPTTEEAPAEEAAAAEPAAEETPVDAATEEPAAEEGAATEEAPPEEEQEEDPEEKIVQKIENLSQKPVVDDYSLASELKKMYEPILNADTLKEKTAAIKNYQQIIDSLAKKAEKNEKIMDALEKTRLFIRADSVGLARRLFRKLKK